MPGGQPYGALSYSKDSLHQLPCMHKASLSAIYLLLCLWSKERKLMNQPGNQTKGFNTIDLHIKIACFVKKEKFCYSINWTNLYKEVNSTDPSSFTKDSLHQLTCILKAGKTFSNLFIIMSVIERKKTNESTRKPNQRGRLDTIGLLNKIACFVK